MTKPTRKSSSSQSLASTSVREALVEETAALIEQLSRDSVPLDRETRALVENNIADLFAPREEKGK